MKENIISVKELCKNFEISIVDRITFDVKRGEIFGDFLEQQEPGKTTAIRMLCGLLPHFRFRHCCRFLMK